MARRMLVVCPARRPRARALCLVTFVTAMVSSGVPSRPAFGAAADDKQLVLAGAGAVKIAVRGAGWVRVGQPALVAAGLDPLRRSRAVCSSTPTVSSRPSSSPATATTSSPRTRRSSSGERAAIRTGPTRARTGWWRAASARASRPRRAEPPRWARRRSCGPSASPSGRSISRRFVTATTATSSARPYRRRPRCGRWPRITSTPVKRARPSCA